MIFIFNTTALYVAVENENVEVVKMLLANDKIDVSYEKILNKNIFNQIPKSHNSITFKNHMF